MKRILFIATTNLLWNDGGALGQRGYLASIKKLSNDRVDVIMPEEGCKGDYKDAIGAPRRPLIKSILSGSIHRYKAFVSRYLSEHKNTYEYCFIFGGIYAGDMMDIVHSHGIKIIVTHLNYEPEYQMDNRTQWTFYGLTPFFVKRNEREAYLKADVNCFMSNDDKILFERNYGVIETPSIIIGCYEYTKESLNDVEINNTLPEKKIAITGSMNTIQTVNGILDFKFNYYNVFNNLCSQWKIVIAGRNPSKDIYDFQNEHSDLIEVIPNPTNMSDIIRSASIFYCPTNSGGGIKLRLMDGLKAGKPVLVHKISARGYDCLWDKPFFRVYDNKESFAEGLRDLLEYLKFSYNPTEIRKSYLDYFSLEAGTKRYNRVFEILKNN